MELFKIIGMGGSPTSVFRNLKKEGNIPSSIESFQLLAMPEGTQPDRYIDAIKDQFQGKAGCFILRLEDDVTKVPKEVLTGKCTNNEVKHTGGARKWVTTYVVYTDNVQRFTDANGIEHDIAKPIQISAHDTKGDAVTAAKDYAVNNNCKTYIRLEKRLDANSGQQLIGEYEPQTKTVYEEKVVPRNRYLYFGMAEHQESTNEAEEEIKEEAQEESVSGF